MIDLFYVSSFYFIVERDVKKVFFYVKVTDNSPYILHFNISLWDL